MEVAIHFSPEERLALSRWRQVEDGLHTGNPYEITGQRSSTPAGKRAGRRRPADEANFEVAKSRDDMQNPCVFHKPFNYDHYSPVHRQQG